MKKFLVICVLCLLVQTASEAKDYVKHHIKEMKKSQQYAATNSYFSGDKNSFLPSIVLKYPFS